MLTITISTRALIIGALLIAASAAAVFATDALAGGSGDQQIQGDVNCDLHVDTDDVLAELLHEVRFEAAQVEPCTDIGDLLPQAVGPQGPPGINLFANVDYDGTLLSGTAVSALSPEYGTYYVTFDQDVTNCAAVATAGVVGASSKTTVATTRTGTVAGAEVVQVDLQVAIYNLPNAVPFDLIVVC